MKREEDRLTRRRAVFIQDARRRLAALSESLLALERDPADRTALDEARRALHTLKGNAGLVGLRVLAATAHTLEDALADTALLAQPTLLARGLDALSAMVAAAAETVDETSPPIPVIEALAAAGEGGQPRRTAAPAGGDSPGTREGLSRSPQVTLPLHHLDNLLELAEELRVSHEETAHAPLEMLERHLARHRRLLHELHDAVLATRLLPVGQAFEGCDRLVRDLAEGLGRQARLVTEGIETEIDRSALDPVRELVVHLLRNAVGHGIESPAERQAAGKPDVGTVRLSARAESDGVVIEVSDDGRGLDRERVAARAAELGLCTAEEAVAAAADPSDERLWAFLARPGFSTQERVDQLAGRGMGLDAVRQGVEGLRGRLTFDSRPGRGTTVRLWLPAMMALEEVVLVGTGPETYAVLGSCVERVCLAEEAEDLAVIDLCERLGVPAEVPSTSHTLLVCHRAGDRVGLLVDGVVGREVTVIKPLPRRARRPVLLGGVVTGAGRVVLVLDVERL